MTNVDISWREFSDKKRNWNSPEMPISRKRPKMIRYQLSNPMFITISITSLFEGLEEELNDTTIR
jgi:hypothetical protein